MFKSVVIMLALSLSVGAIAKDKEEKEKRCRNIKGHIVVSFTSENCQSPFGVCTEVIFPAKNGRSVKHIVSSFQSQNLPAINFLVSSAAVADYKKSRSTRRFSDELLHEFRTAPNKSFLS